MVLPWNDRAGRFSPLKAVVVAACCLPALWLIVQGVSTTAAAPGSVGLLGARPITEALHQMGDWAIRFLLLSLAVTPFRRIANFSKLILVRRMLGLTALFYATAHFLLYIVDQKFDLFRVASEIALRFYLTIGFAALLGLIALGSTSTDAAIRRLGKNWTRLHKLVYPIAALGLLHYFIQTKANVFQPTLLAGFFVVLMLYRVAQARGFALNRWPVLAAIAVLGAVATVAIECAWYGLATGVPSSRVFFANFNFVHQIRPAWWVLAAGLAVAILAPLRAAFSASAPTPRGRREARQAA